MGQRATWFLIGAAVAASVVWLIMFQGIQRQWLDALLGLSR